METVHSYRKHSIIPKTKWSEIFDAKFDESCQKLTLFTTSSKMLNIYSSYNWESFLYHLALLKLPSLDYEFIKKLFLNLESCEICGKIAIFEKLDDEGEIEKSCLSCLNDSWDEEKDGGDENYSKESYIIDCQLDHFETYSPEEKIDFHFEDDAFIFDSEWKPLVTEEEVLKYSRENNWLKNKKSS